MKQFLSVTDVTDLPGLVDLALQLKKEPLAFERLGRGKTIGLVFFNPSLRTRLSTQLAARKLGLEVLVMNVQQDGWSIETADGAIMNGDKAEHIREAAGVMGQYCDLLGVRTFPDLINRENDYAEHILHQFVRFSGVPVISLESATRHPLQSLADLVTIREKAPVGRKAKVLLRWAPHVKALPQAVPNSFAEWMLTSDQVDLAISYPKGYALAPEFRTGAHLFHEPEAGLAEADFVYVKNWSSYEQYGQILNTDPAWMLDEKCLKVNPGAKVMHCLPVRRNVVISDAVLDGPQSVVLEQAGNRIWAAQAVLHQMLSAL